MQTKAPLRGFSDGREQVWKRVKDTRDARPIPRVSAAAIGNSEESAPLILQEAGVAKAPTSEREVFDEFAARREQTRDSSG